MAHPSAKKRIWGWFFFDWATQPYHTLLVTFIFSPFFAGVATEYFMGLGLDEGAADAQAQVIWSRCLFYTGLVIGFGGPIMGALADTSGRRMPWIVGFSALYVLGASALWFTDPAGGNMWAMLFAFGIGFIGAEYALIFTNAQLPSLGTKEEVGKLSGSGFAFGYIGGLLALAIMLGLFVEQANGRTLAGLEPVLGLDAQAREGTRAVGPFVALWFLIFMVPYFLWVREVNAPRQRPSMGAALSMLKDSIAGLKTRRSTLNFLLSSMFYRDALNGLYTFGGVYARLVLNWELTLIGVFGIVSGLAAALFSYLGGFADRKFGPKPVIIAAVAALMLVVLTVVFMSRESFFGMPLAEGSKLPDTVFFICGMVIGGAGGTLQAASRSLMTRHAEEGRETESFGLYGFSGRATSFIAPGLIGIVTAATGSARLGVSPLIGLFALGLVLLIWVKPNGEPGPE